VLLSPKVNAARYAVGARSCPPATPAGYTPSFFRTPAAPRRPRSSGRVLRFAGVLLPCGTLRRRGRSAPVVCALVGPDRSANFSDGHRSGVIGYLSLWWRCMWLIWKGFRC